jgi:amphi-Trp domain-containing protein
MSKKEINLNVILNKDEIIQYLESLAQNLKSEKLVIEKGNQFLSLTPSAQIEINVEAKQKKGKEKLRIELSWSTEEASVPADFLKIFSTDPEPLDAESDVQTPPAEVEPLKNQSRCDV